jgi:hypothetical protein
MRIKSKKERDMMKHLHNHFGFQLPRSPISPTPSEVEIPTFDQRVRMMINSNMINYYGSMFFESGEGSSSSAAPPPPPGSEEVPQPFGAPHTTTERSYGNTNLCYSSSKDVLLRNLVTQLVCVLIFNVTMVRSFGTNNMCHFTSKKVLPPGNTFTYLIEHFSSVTMTLLCNTFFLLL